MSESEPVDRVKLLTYQKGLFTREFVLKAFELDMSIGFLKIHWQRMEEIFESESQDWQDKLSRVKEKDKDLWASFDRLLFKKALKDWDKYVQFIRRSFLVSLFSFFESELNGICQFLGGDSNLRFDSIDEAKKYLTEDLRVGFSFGSSSEWNKIQQYKHIRNCIVHYNGVVPAMESDKAKRIQGYIKKSPLLTLNEDTVNLHKDLCGIVIRVIDEFFWSLLVSVSDNYIEISLDELTSDENIN